MSLAETLQIVTKSSNRFAPTFAEARARIPELAPHADPASILAALDLALPSTHEERDALLNALVLEEQRSKSPLWSSILCAAFRPMLLRLRRRLGTLPNDDLDQAVLSSFLAAVHAVRAGHYTAIALRWATEKAVFAEIRAGRRQLPTKEFDERRYAQDLFGLDAERKLAAAELANALEAQGGDQLFELIFASGEGDDSLKAWVAANTPGDEATQRAAYDRIRQSRLVVLRELRARFAERAA